MAGYGLAYIKRLRIDSLDGPGIAGGDVGPHDPAMEARVSALEVGFQEMKGSLHRLELSIARIEAALSHMATKADVAANTGAINALAEKMAAQNARLTKVEAAIEDTLKTALSKTIGPWQVPGILAVCVALIGVLMAALNWAGHQPWFPH
jgi:hypothetical protein